MTGESVRPDAVDEQVTVDGQAVTTVVRAIERGCGFFGDRARGVLADNGIDEPVAGETYPLAAVLSAYEDLLETTGEHTVHRIGKELAHVLSWDPETESVADALDALDDVYGHIHSGNAGTYEFERTGEETGRLVSKTPYPAALEAGLLRGIAQRFSETGYVDVETVQSRREDGMHVTTLCVEWWQSTTIDAPVGSVAGMRRPAAGD